MSEAGSSFYKDMLDKIKDRENEELKLQNEVLVLREKCFEMLMNLNELVDPEKSCFLDDIIQLIKRICSTETEEAKMIQNVKGDDSNEPELDVDFGEIIKLIEKHAVRK